MPIKMLSPVGRIVQGNPLFKSAVMEDDGKTQKVGKDGQPSFNYWFNVAFDKRDPEVWPMICAIKQDAAASFPQLFPQGWNPNAANEGCVRPDFAFKIKDGDGMDLNGKPHANKEGWGGCYILQISTYAAQPRCYDGLANNTPITELEQIHTGKFVRVSLDIKSNGWTGQGNSKPGIFVNPDGVQLVGHGSKISSGPDAATMFAAPVAGYIPPGMSTTAPVAAIAMPGQPAPQAPQGAPVMPTPQAAPAPTMPQMQAPAPMGQQPQMQAPITPAPQAPVMPQMQAAVPNQNFTQAALAPTYTMTPAAQGFTREQWHAAGQTDQTLIAAGMMTVA